MSRKVRYGGSWVNVETAIPAVQEELGLQPANLVPYTTSISCPTNAAANTKGIWTEIITSTAADGSLISLHTTATGGSTLSSAALFDIGIGAEGFEVPLVENIAVPYFGFTSTSYPVDIPIQVPAGSRLSVRWQSGRASVANCNARINVYDYSDFTVPSSVTTIGANTATSTGVALTTVDTMTEIIDATVEDYKGVVVTFTCTDTDTAGSEVVFYIGTGPSMDNYYTNGYSFVTNTSETFTTIPGGTSSFIPLSIPAGTRIGAMYKELSGGPNTGYSVVLIGVPA